MAINSISQILVNGSPQIFGGYVFSARVAISMGDGQSTIQISIVNESGQYDINQGMLQQTFCQPYNISIGSQLVFSCYLTSYRKTVSPGGNTVTLNFVDSSRMLDIIFVGLFKKHGLVSTDYLILLGKEIDPCNPDPYTNQISTAIFDPCSPCITSEKQQKITNYIDCKEKNKFQILDVKYRFGQLLEEMQKRGLQVRNAVDPNPSYLVQHVGSLRAVLNAFCEEFGWFFYYDNGIIVFKDLRATIEVSASIENFCPNLLDYEEEVSVESSFKTATITNFSRPGDGAKVSECQSAIYIEAASLQQNVQYSMPLTVTPSIDRVAAGLTYYSEDLRNLYYFYSKYQMYNLNNFKAGKKLEKLGITILTEAILLGESLEGEKTIGDVAAPKEAGQVAASAKTINPFVVGSSNSTHTSNITEIKANAKFYACIQALDDEIKWKIIANPKNYYFFLATYNEPENSKFLEEEKEFAGFLNKYAVYVPNPNDKFFEDYDFQLDDLCGQTYFTNTNNVSYQFTPDATFINTSAKGERTAIGQLPFARFLSVIRDDQSGSTSPQAFLPFKLIYAERGQNNYLPDGAAQNNGQYPSIRTRSLIDSAYKYFPMEIPVTNNSRGESLLGILGGSAPPGGHYSLFIGTKVDQDDFRLTEINGYNDEATFGTLFDGKPLNKVVDPTTQAQKIIYQYPELKCKILGNHSYGGPTTLRAKKIVFHTPITKFEYTEPTDALYGMVIEKTVTKRKVVEKLESFNSTNLEGADTCDYSKLIVNSRNISDDRLSVITKKNDICQFDAQQIKDIHEQFSKNLAINYNQPTISKTFKIAGIELNGYTPSIENGLISLEIGIDSNGVYSVYEFGTRLMQLPNEDAINFNLSKNLDMFLPHGSYANTTNYYPLVLGNQDT